jgi:hypothetical protein
VSGVDVTPSEMQRAARNFAVGQQTLSGAWSRLEAALGADGSMAGNDSLAHNFDSRYAPGVKAAVKAFQKSVIVTGGISLGLTRTANNHLKADNASATGKSRPKSPLLNPEPVVRELYVCYPPPALGTGHSALPGPLAKYWPNADVGKLRSAARAWHAAAGTVQDVGGKLNATINGLSTAAGSDSHAIGDFWGKVYKSGNPHTVLAGLYELCESLGDSCDRYATAVEHARSQMKGALVGAGIAIGVTTAIGILGSIVTLGGSDAGAAAADAAEAAAILGPIAEDAAATVATETAAAIAEDLPVAVEAAADTAPEIGTAEAEATEVEPALEEDLGKAESDAIAKDPDAKDLIKNGQEYKGTGGRGGNLLPNEGGPPNGTLYKTDPQTGEVTNYTTYDMDGNAIKRVDLTGGAHGGVPTPHVVEYDVNVNPNTGQSFVRQQKMVRPAEPWEIP